MTPLTPRNAVDAAPVIAAPVLPDGLRRVVGMVVEPLSGAPLAVFRPDEREAARAAGPAFAKALEARATRAQIGAWLAPLVIAVPFSPKDASELAGFVALVGDACGDLPAVVWSQETRAEALRQWHKWPSVADVNALLRPRAERLWAELQALRTIATSSDSPREPAAEREERPAVAAIQAIMRKHGYRSVLDDPPKASQSGKPPVARGVSPEQQAQRDARLLAEYERLAASGGPSAAAAKMRLEALRKQRVVG